MYGENMITWSKGEWFKIIFLYIYTSWVLVLHDGFIFYFHKKYYKKL